MLQMWVEGMGKDMENLFVGHSKGVLSMRVERKRDNRRYNSSYVAKYEADSLKQVFITGNIIGRAIETKLVRNSKCSVRVTEVSFKTSGGQLGLVGDGNS